MTLDETLAIPALRAFLEQNRDMNFISKLGSLVTQTCIMARFFDDFEPGHKHSCTHTFVRRMDGTEQANYVSPVFMAITQAFDEARDLSKKSFTGADALRIMEKYNG